MIPTVQEAMLSLTPPPSELDDFETSTLMSCSPPMSGLCYPSPAPSQQASQIPSGRSKAMYIPEHELSFTEGMNPPQESTEMYFTEPSESSLYPIVSIPGTGMTQYGSNSMTETFPAVYDHAEQWLPYQSYPDPNSMAYSYHQQSDPLYINYDHQLSHSLTNIVPPTPQDIAPTQTNFNFNSLPTVSRFDRRQSLNHQMTASPCFSHPSQRSGHQSSRTSLSRSCSPNPSNSHHISQLVDSSSSSNILSSMHDQKVGNKPFRPSLRTNSTSSSSSLHAYGIPLASDSTSQRKVSIVEPLNSSVSSSSSTPQPQPAWRCAYPGCTSRATFTRGCDLRKHYNRHSKHLFCRIEGCPQSEAANTTKNRLNHGNNDDQLLTGGFSSKKDRARHEAKHNPGIRCEWRTADGEQCGRLFSRMDNMKDHVRRIHKKAEQKLQHTH